jgi:membrane-anchored protein YejM (alkaline phosphatase superfamily)
MFEEPTIIIPWSKTVKWLFWLFLFNILQLLFILGVGIFLYAKFHTPKNYDRYFVEECLKETQLYKFECIRAGMYFNF